VLVLPQAEDALALLRAETDLQLRKIAAVRAVRARRRFVEDWLGSFEQICACM
jgi:hypothetical protein